MDKEQEQGSYKIINVNFNSLKDKSFIAAQRLRINSMKYRTNAEYKALDQQIKENMLKQ